MSSSGPSTLTLTTNPNTGAGTSTLTSSFYLPLDVLILAWIARTWWKGYAAIREAEVTADAQIYTAQVNLLVKRQELRARGIQVADVEPQPGFFRRRGGSVEEVRNPFAEAFERVRRGMIVALGGVVDEEW